MKIEDALPDGTCLLLDSAPIIYYFEKHGRYFPIVKAIFERINKGLLTAITTPVTLAEALSARCDAIWCRLDDRLRFAAHQ
jgi:hypothetical protein